MTDTAIIGRNVEVLESRLSGSNSPFSWSAAIAGALAATAVSFILISLGSGIGLSVASPYRVSPSATTLTAIGAVWLVMAQAFGFATGGYLAARLRRHSEVAVGEDTTFRDAAQGFVVWALGVVGTLVFAALLAVLTANAGATVAGGAAAGQPGAAAVSSVRGMPTSDYYVDMLFRSTSAGPTGSEPSPQAAPEVAQTRNEANRLVGRSIIGQASDEDRAQLARLVSARTGLPPDEATRRVDTVNKNIKDTADKAAKAASMLSFWTFFALLFGAVAGALGGIVGGELRDQHLRGELR
jgi:hypothetical protein